MPDKCCGTCKFWKPIYTPFCGSCCGPVPWAVVVEKNEPVHDFDGHYCPTYKQKPAPTTSQESLNSTGA